MMKNIDNKSSWTMPESERERQSQLERGDGRQRERWEKACQRETWMASNELCTGHRQRPRNALGVNLHNWKRARNVCWNFTCLLSDHLDDKHTTELSYPETVFHTISWFLREGGGLWCHLDGIPVQKYYDRAGSAWGGIWSWIWEIPGHPTLSMKHC